MIRKILNNEWITFGIIFPVLFIPITMFLSRHNDLKEEQRREAERQEYKEEVKAEVRRRQLITDTTADSINPVENTEPTQAQDRTDTSIAPITEGPFKGMTYIEAQKLPEWHARKRELRKKSSEHTKKLLAQVDALLTPKKERLPVILSVFPLLSTEQLKYARENALKTMPPEDVEVLFNALAEISTTKTAEQVAEEVKGIITVRQADDIVNWELDVEFEQYQQGKRELYGAEEYEKQMEEARKRIEESDRRKRK